MRIKIRVLLIYICYVGYFGLITGCSTVKKMPDDLPDGKYSGSTKKAAPTQIKGNGLPGTGDGGGKGSHGTGSGNGKGVTGAGSGNGENNQAGSKTGKSKAKATGQGVTDKGAKAGTAKAKKIEDEVAGFLNLNSQEPATAKGKGQHQGHGLPQEKLPQSIPLATAMGKTGERITRTPSANAGEKLIADLKKIRVTDEKFTKEPPRLILDKPRRASRKFNAPPPVVKKVNDSFMPYKPGQIVHLDANLVPVKKSASRIICLYSGASVYLSFKTDEVKMGGLYVLGKFKVRGIVKENFSGNEVPVAILDKL